MSETKLMALREAVNLAMSEEMDYMETKQHATKKTNGS